MAFFHCREPIDLDDEEEDSACYNCTMGCGMVTSYILFHVFEGIFTICTLGTCTLNNNKIVRPWVRNLFKKSESHKK